MLGTLTKDQMEHILRRQIVGRIGCCEGNEMYIVPVTFVYHQDYIYAHSKEGRKVQIMRQNPHVCFQVDSVDNLTNWRSVLLWGEYEELKGEKAQKAGMKIMTDRLMPYLMSEAVRPSHGLSRPPAVIERGYKAVVYRIRISRMSGRYEKTSISEIYNDFNDFK